jgi:hypothetical protein
MNKEKKLKEKLEETKFDYFKDKIEELEARLEVYLAKERL